MLGAGHHEVDGARGDVVDGVTLRMLNVMDHAVPLVLAEAVESLSSTRCRRRCLSPASCYPSEIRLEVELKQNTIRKHLKKLEKFEASSRIKGLAPNATTLMERLP